MKQRQRERSSQHHLIVLSMQIEDVLEDYLSGECDKVRVYERGDQSFRKLAL